MRRQIFKRPKTEQQVKGLTSRWLIDVLSIVVVVVVVAIVISAVSVYNFYYDTVRQDLRSKLNISCDVLTSYNCASDAEFELQSKKFLSYYFEKKSYEVQVFDRHGKMITSSQGFRPDDELFADYNIAKTDPEGTGEWIGKTKSGESVMAVTAVLPAADRASMGALRFVVSMDSVNAAIRNSIFVILGCGVAIILLIALMSALFLRSIVRPVRAITDTAFKIASGDFDARLHASEKDKSEVGKLCDTINYMASELKSSETLKNDFISSVSHELRTPLTAIKGWGETVKMSIGADDELVKKGVDIILKETGRLSGLVEDLLDFSRLQSGRLSIRLEQCDILAELSEAVYMYKEPARRASVTIDYVEPQSLPFVMADAARLKQVFINIIDNAVKYSSEGGTVTVRAAQHDIYILVTVVDNGCGIAAEDLSKVKEKFFKANHTVNGSGIGLAVADEIIKQHNGILEIDSKEGEGTSVSIILPFIQTAEKSDKKEEGNV